MSIKFKPIGYAGSAAVELFKVGHSNYLTLSKESDAVFKVPLYLQAIYESNPWKDAILESMCQYGVDASADTAPEELLKLVIESAIAINSDPAINKDRAVVAYKHESKGISEYYIAAYLQAKTNKVYLSKAYTPLYSFEANMFPMHYNEFIVRYSEEVFVVFDPLTDGSQILGGCRTYVEAANLLEKCYQNSTAVDTSKEDLSAPIDSLAIATVDVSYCLPNESGYYRSEIVSKERIAVDTELYLHPQLKPCKSPYCECSAGKCTHPGFYDARGE